MAACDFENIFNFLPVPACVCQDGFICLVNRQMTGLTGYTEKELLQLQPAALVYQEDWPRVKNNALNPERVQENHEFRVVNRHKDIIFVRGFFSVVEYKNRPAILGQLVDIAEEKRARETLVLAHEKYQMLVNCPNVGIVVAQDGIIKFINPFILNITGYSWEEAISRSFAEFIHPDDREIMLERHYRRIKGALPPQMYSFRAVTKEGHIKWMETNTVLFTWEGQPATLSFLSDITERRCSEEELALQRVYFQQLFENSPEGIVVLDNKDRIIDVNKGFTKLFQYTTDEIKGCYLNDVIVPRNLAQEADAASNSVLCDGIAQKETVRRRKDGSLVDVSILGYPIVIGGKKVGIFGIYSDIIERKQAEQQLKFLSLHDSLTGLYNRTYFEQEMRLLEKSQCTPVGIILCDVDGLKLVNDTLGHNTGDGLLKIAAGIIRKSFREGDMVARIGGDEFAVLLPKSDKKIIENVVRRIRHGVSGYNEKNPELPLSISIGFAIKSEASEEINDIFKEADNNMYREKLNRSQSVRSAIVQTLMQALEARDFITEGHAERLQGLVAVIAQAIGLPESQITALRLLAQFHDIGKVGIPDRILFKPGPLTREEFSEMQRHCEIGNRIAQSAQDLVHIADWILKHHEWWNGKGYPLGLKHKEIPIECRILAISDAYDAMTSDRPYRKALPHEKAVFELKKCAGSQFDPELVSIFLKTFPAPAR